MRVRPGPLRGRSSEARREGRAPSSLSLLTSTPLPLPHSSTFRAPSTWSPTSTSLCALCAVASSAFCFGGEHGARKKKKHAGRGKGIRVRSPRSPRPPPTHPHTRSRQFNHRCKGVTMATFKAEEIQAIEDGGNAVRKRKGMGDQGAGRKRRPPHSALTLLSHTYSSPWAPSWPAGPPPTCQSPPTGHP